MRRLKGFLFLILIWAGTALAVGPVGRYLGIAVGKSGRAIINGTDSVHLYWPTPDDTSWVTTGLDTTTILLEFNMGGNPAYLRFYRYHGSDTSYVDADTCWEESAIYLKSKDEFFDTFMIFTPYKIPFTIGSTWPLGIGGTYYVDIDGDGQRDTFKIWADTVKVISQEDVRVPYGLVRNAFKLYTHSLGYIGMTTSGIWVRDTLNVNIIEWYKDSLWAVKDSTAQLERMYINFGGMWIHYADGFHYRVSQLTNLWVGIEDEISTAVRDLKIGPNPFAQKILIGAPDINQPSTISIYDASGRMVLQREFNKIFIWQPHNLPAGIYYPVLKSKNGKAVNLGPVIYLKRTVP